MKGKNEIYINQATMLEAVDLWLKDQFKNAPSALSVKKNTNTHGAGSDQFIITVDQNSASKEPSTQKGS